MKTRPTPRSRWSEDDVATNSLHAWFLAARPKTLIGAAVPVMLGAAYAFRIGGWEHFRWQPAVLCFLFAFIMQIDANFVNDYFDCLKGNDKSATRLGPKRACSEGWITLPTMRIGLMATTALAGLIGFPLVIYGGWEMIAVGLVCMAFCFLYTTRLSYLGLGDVLVLVFFGVVPVCLTCYVILPDGTERFSRSLFCLSVLCGFVIDTLLVVNNYRDIDNDRRDGKKTLVVRIGARRAERLYLLLGCLAVLGTLILLDSGSVTSSTGLIAHVLPFLYLDLHLSTYSKMKRIGRGRELNRILGKTARNMFIFGITASASVLLAG